MGDFNGVCWMAFTHLFVHRLNSVWQNRLDSVWQVQSCSGPSYCRFQFRGTRVIARVVDTKLLLDYVEA